MYINKNINLKKKKQNIVYKNWRIITIYTLIFMFLVILTLRIIFLQFIDSKKLSYEGDRRTLRIQNVINVRGIINDRTGYPLAVTVPVNAIFIDPNVIKNNINIKNNIKWKKLSDILSIPINKIISYTHTDKHVKFIYLARHVPTEIASYIQSLKLPGIYLKQEGKRYYPSGHIASQLLGFNNIDDVGIEGIEKSFNSHLIGIPGKRQIRRDNQGRVIENNSLINKCNAKDLILSIDKDLQNITYKILYEAVNKNKADCGIAILTDIKTGEILSMATSPSYNTNEHQYTISEHFRNRAITDVFEPGSTIKPIVIMEALKQGLIQPNSMINTQSLVFKKHNIKDVAYYKKLNIKEILQKSSNVGVSKIALSMNIKDLINTYFQFGLGHKTNLHLIGERQGYLPKKKVLSNLEKATISFGYGLMVTPIQLAKAYTTIGSYGIDRPLSIVKINHPAYEKQIFPQKYVKSVINMMERVIHSNDKIDKLASKKYRFAIKTGTSKKVGDQGRYIDKYVAYTAGIAPVSDPKFSLIIVIDNPRGKKYYGGAVAAPVFNKIMTLALEMMKIKPDKS